MDMKTAKRSCKKLTSKKGNGKARIPYTEIRTAKRPEET
jgi:hypothetical protein